MLEEIVETSEGETAHANVSKLFVLDIHEY